MNSSSGPEPHTVYEFGEFRLDAGRRLLYAKGGSTALAIKPKVLDALLYFVEHPGQLLEKDRLLTELWPGLVVEENGLTQTISALRGVLGETPGENRYLATVPGRGYRFVAVPVVGRRLPAPPSPSHRQEPAAIGPPAAVSAPRTRPRPRRTVVAAHRCDPRARRRARRRAPHLQRIRPLARRHTRIRPPASARQRQRPSPRRGRSRSCRSRT